MPLTYAPRPYRADTLKGMAETSSTEERVSLLTDAVRTLVDQLNAEQKRTGFAINSAGGEKAAFRATTVDTFLASTDRTLACDATAGAINVTLPLTSEYPGITYCLLRSAGANAVTLLPRGSDTVAGGASATITAAQWFQADSVTGNWISL